MRRDLTDYQAKYAEQPYEKHQASFRKKEIKRILANNPHAVILEIGCGLESIFLQLDAFAKIVVVEPTAVFFEKAQRDAKNQNGQNIAVINASLENAHDRIKHHRFDFILVSCLLHEVLAPEAFLAAVRNLCHADTVVHINVPNAGSFHRLLAVEMGLIKNVRELSPANVQFQQRVVFDMDLLHRVAEDAGFEILGSGAYMLKPFTHAQMQKMIDCGVLTRDVLDGLYAMGKHVPSLCSEIYINTKIKNA